MSLSKIRRKKQKGFTLVELMIVIAVIAVLAAVLIPKSNLVQNSARETGVLANARQIQGIIEGMMHKNYSSGSEFRNALESKINGIDMTNPFTGKIDAEQRSAAEGPSGSHAVVISADAAPTDTGDSNEYKGIVWVQISDGTDLAIVITPYGADKLPIEGGPIRVR